MGVITEDRHEDLIASAFDVGLQFGAFIEQDMIAVPVSPEHR